MIPIFLRNFAAEIFVYSFVSETFWPTLTDGVTPAAIGEARVSSWHGSGLGIAGTC